MTRRLTASYVSEWPSRGAGEVDVDPGPERGQAIDDGGGQWAVGGAEVDPVEGAADPEGEVVDGREEVPGAGRPGAQVDTEGEVEGEVGDQVEDGVAIEGQPERREVRPEVERDGGEGEGGLEMDGVDEGRVGWVLAIWLGFLIPHTVVAGGLHLFFFRARNGDCRCCPAWYPVRQNRSVT